MTTTTPEQAERRLKLLLGLLMFWDTGLGLIALFAPHGFETWVNLTPQDEPMFRRVTGVYLCFGGFYQFLGWRNPRKYVLAVQLIILFRITGAMIEATEASLIRPFGLIPHALLVFVTVGDLVFAWIKARYLRLMGLPWFDISRT